jgi:hypothetical protein
MSIASYGAVAIYGFRADGEYETGECLRQLQDAVERNGENEGSMKTINPSEMKFVFQLSTGECHKKLTGMCSLDKPPSEDDDGESGARYCQELYASLVRYGCRQDVYIGESSCGHYIIGDGQHRICIAKRKNLLLPATVEANTDGCDFCQNYGEVEDGELW